MSWTDARRAKYLYVQGCVECTCENTKEALKVSVESSLKNSITRMCWDVRKISAQRVHHINQMLKLLSSSAAVKWTL